jgi:cytochrome c-type biogenesis protein CcmF
MTVDLGFGLLVLTLIVTVYAAVAAIVGVSRNDARWVNSARLASLITFPLLTLVVAVVLYLITTGHYEVSYVYAVSSNAMPLYLKLTALWGGQAGSLVFWSWLMAAFSSAVMLRKWERDREFLPWVIVVTMITLIFFLGMVIFFENPFVRFWGTPMGNRIEAMFPPLGSELLVPNDGRGLNPLLRHPGMIIHPPMLYLGFVSFVIPFAFALAALITGRTDDRWIRITRRWTLVAWLFLTIGLVLGMRWAYDVLGWGGYWGWDPVEIAALMPWLTGTAFLHSVMIQEKRGMFKQWNMLLIILTYDLVIYGTFLTRSGVLSSVHAFAQSAIGPLFFAFIALTFVVSIWLMLLRWKSLRSEGQLHSLLSRETLFLVNNLLFLGLFIECFWGVNFPLLSEIVTGQKVTFGPEWYIRATGPLWGGLLLLMGIAPISAWQISTMKTLGRAFWKPLIPSVLAVGAVVALGIRQVGAVIGFWLIALVASVTIYEYWRGIRSRSRSTGENVFQAVWRLTAKNRRRYGGYIIHLGIIFMAMGVIGIEAFQQQTQGALTPGQSLEVAGYTVTYKSLAEWDTADGKNVARAVMEVSRDGKVLQELYPRRDYYYDSQQPMTIPGVRATMEDDIYVILVDWEPISTRQATFKVFRNPLVSWLWFGSIILILGSIIAVWPTPEREAAR